MGHGHEHAVSTIAPIHTPLSYADLKPHLTLSAYPPPDPQPELFSAHPIPPAVFAPVPWPRFVPLPPRKSAPVQQRRFAFALPPINAQPAAQGGAARHSVTMNQYRLKSYGYAMVKEDQTAGRVLYYEDPE